MARSDEYIETECLVLHKIAYGETSLIAAGLSPDRGQVRFLLRGARKLGKKKFPALDLFRVLAVRYRPPRGELAVFYSAAVVEDFRGLSTVPEAFLLASWLSRLALRNTHEEDAVPRFYAILRAGFRRLAGRGKRRLDLQGLPAGMLAAASVLALLADHGLLPPPASAEDAQRRNRLLAAVQGEKELPDRPEVAGTPLLEWARALADSAGLDFPEWPKNPSERRRPGGVRTERP